MKNIKHIINYLLFGIVLTSSIFIMTACDIPGSGNNNGTNNEANNDTNNNTNNETDSETTKGNQKINFNKGETKDSIQFDFYKNGEKETVNLNNKMEFRDVLYKLYTLNGTAILRFYNENQEYNAFASDSLRNEVKNEYDRNNDKLESYDSTFINSGNEKIMYQNYYNRSIMGTYQVDEENEHNEYNFYGHIQREADLSFPQHISAYAKRNYGVQSLINKGIFYDQDINNEEEYWDSLKWRKITDDFGYSLEELLYFDDISCFTSSITAFNLQYNYRDPLIYQLKLPLIFDKIDSYFLSSQERSKFVKLINKYYKTSFELTDKYIVLTLENSLGFNGYNQVMQHISEITPEGGIINYLKKEFEKLNKNGCYEKEVVCINYKDIEARSENYTENSRLTIDYQYHYSNDITKTQYLYGSDDDPYTYYTYIDMETFEQKEKRLKDADYPYQNIKGKEYYYYRSLEEEYECAATNLNLEDYKVFTNKIKEEVKKGGYNLADY